MDQSQASSTSSRRLQRSSQQRAVLLEAYRNSTGKTIKAFCEEQGIPTGTFYNWIKRQKKTQPVKARQSGFVRLTVTELPPLSKTDHGQLFAEVSGIRLYREVPAAYLKALLS